MYRIQSFQPFDIDYFAEQSIDEAKYLSFMAIKRLLIEYELIEDLIFSPTNVSNVNNDDIMLTYVISDKNIESIKNIIVENYNNWVTYIEDIVTPKSGYIPFIKEDDLDINRIKYAGKYLYIFYEYIWNILGFDINEYY
jgi:aromatic ring hydroxylase